MHVITDTPPSTCDLCSKEEELRPYGPKGEWVCFDCGMKDEAAALKAYTKILQGSTNTAGNA